MMFRPLTLAPVLLLALATSACEMPPDLRMVAANNLSTPSNAPGVVHTSPICGEANGGRHFGDPTPWSENPFNACWPQ
jgi:hypothetical protein